MGDHEKMRRGNAPRPARVKPSRSQMARLAVLLV